jgi:ABC-type antimicrobial peptide transport system permease subunit
VRSITATRRFNTIVMTAFGVIGVLIGALGIYGVMASIVAQRTREIGVRVALGATPALIRRGILTMAIRHTAIGLAIGLPLAWWASRSFAAFLFHVTPTDVSVYAGVAVLLTVVALAAAIVPARRAARTDPVISLRAS